MKKYVVFAAFAATVPAANWLIGNAGTTCVPDGPCLIPVGFGLMAPSGVLMIGLALVLRDWLHEVAGWKWSLLAVLFGGILSLLFSAPSLALASASAFVVAEIADFAVYSKLRDRGRHLAVAVSQVFGSVIDSFVFVLVAFGSLQFGIGNALGKIYAGVAVALFIYARGKRK